MPLMLWLAWFLGSGIGTVVSFYFGMEARPYSTSERVWAGLIGLFLVAFIVSICAISVVHQ